MTRPSYWDPNVEEIPEQYLDRAQLELPGAGADDLNERATELWTEARRDARDDFEEPE